MIYAAGLVLAAFLAIFHVSVMQYIEVLGVTPDLLLIFAACFAVLRKEEESLIVVPLAGLLRDLTTSDPIGTSVLGFAPIVLFAAVIRLRAMETQFIPAVIVSFAGSITYVAVTMCVLGITGHTVDPMQSLIRLALPLAVVDALFTPVLYMPMSWFRAPYEPRVLGPHRITTASTTR
jgi:rod shape-determining protein MreD